ncbi:MAG: hypothetical protein IJX84_08575 [Clostridia bacterium]|nr:hypothetical protein [Clostridia bacterium]
MSGLNCIQRHKKEPDKTSGLFHAKTLQLLLLQRKLTGGSQVAPVAYLGFDSIEHRKLLGLVDLPLGNVIYPEMEELCILRVDPYTVLVGDVWAENLALTDDLVIVV